MPSQEAVAHRAGNEIYGADPQPRAQTEILELGYVMAIG
jgi:hypothetical protein